MSVLPTNYPEMLIDFHSRVVAEINKRPNPPADAAQIALSITELLRVQFGGEMLYIPRGRWHDLHIRDTEIYAKFDGSNHVKLGHEYDLTTKQIYVIVKAIGAAERKKSQRDLFDA